MTIRASKFTPQVLLSAPRRSAGAPNSEGTRVLYSVSTYSFEAKKSIKEIKILDVKSQESNLIIEDASEPIWLNEDEILLLASGEKGITNVLIGPVDTFKDDHYIAGTIDASASNVKVVKVGNGNYLFAITASAKPNGELHNAEKAEKPTNTGRLYNSTFVRHWDSWITPIKNAVWLGTLGKKTWKDSKHSEYELSPLKNALKGTGLECPIPPFGGAEHYDIGPYGLIFTAKDPVVNPSINTKTNVYLIPFIKDEDMMKATKPLWINTKGYEGATSFVAFSPDGRKAAFLKMQENGYESDKNQLFVIPDVQRPHMVVIPYPSGDYKGVWDRSPQSVLFSEDGNTLYITAEDIGRKKLFKISINDLTTADLPLRLPEVLPSVGTVGDVRLLKHNKLFISSSSLVDNSTYSTIGRTNPTEVDLVSSNSRNGAAFGLSSNQVDALWWPGADKDVHIHAWVVKPSNFDPSKKYPLAYVIHGGPQGAWLDSWSTRWNPAVIAEQGYVAVCPNPTGSSGYGQDLTDAITGNWGGSPYEDLVNGFEYIAKHVPYIDTTNAVALGASYGGYMINWIQGHPLGRKFKALVCHDGVFSNTGAQLACEELWFPYHDLYGPLWKYPKDWAKWDPSLWLEHWATPQLTIHSELDYRLTIAEGLSAFNVLQTKGIESQLLTFPDENHWVLKPENSLVWHTVVFDFINQKVGLLKYSDVDKQARERLEEAKMDGFGPKGEETESLIEEVVALNTGKRA